MSTGNAMKRRTRITLGLAGIAAAGFGIFYGVVAGHGISQAAPSASSPASASTASDNSTTTTQQQPSFQQQPTTRNVAPSAPAPRMQVHTRSRGS